MKQKRKNILKISLGVLLVIAISSGLFYWWSRAVPIAITSSYGKIYYKWSSNSVKKDQRIELDISINPVVPIDTVMTKVQYDSEELKYEHVSYDDSAFHTQIPAIVKKDSVMVQSAIMGGDTTDKDTKIAKITFKSMLNGTPKVSISGNSAKAGVALNPSVMGSLYSNRLMKVPIYIRFIICTIISIVLVLLVVAIYVFIKKSKARKKGDISDDEDKKVI